MVYIYVLKHPVTKQIRYVGKTTTPKIRLRNHIYLVGKGKTHCKSWIKSLLNQRLKPEMVIIDKCHSSLGSIREKHWIRVYSKYDLCNHTIGGECGRVSKKYAAEKEYQVLRALKKISKGMEVRQAEKDSGLYHSYLCRVRDGEIAFLSHIKVPYFRELKRNLIDRR